MIDINDAKCELKALSITDSPFGEMCGEILEYINSLEERVAIMAEGKPDDEKCMAEIADHSELKRLKAENKRLREENERLLKEQQWIPLSDKHPEECENVLFSDGYDTFYGYIRKKNNILYVDDWLDLNDEIIGNSLVKYWKPLPKGKVE